MSRSNMIEGKQKYMIVEDTIKGEAWCVGSERRGRIVHRDEKYLVIAYPHRKATRRHFTLPAKTVVFAVYSRTMTTTYATVVTEWQSRSLSSRLKGGAK